MASASCSRCWSQGQRHLQTPATRQQRTGSILRRCLDPKLPQTWQRCTEQTQHMGTWLHAGSHNNHCQKSAQTSCPRCARWRDPLSGGHGPFTRLRHTTLGDLLRQSDAVESQLLRDDGGRLLMYQLLSGLAELHSAARWHGRLTPEHLPLTRDG